MSVDNIIGPDRDSTPNLGESRRRVLDQLTEAGRPLAVDEVASRIGLHPNTARFHLDGLVEDGYADRATEQREQPGRPRALYSARAGAASVGRRSYQLLATILTSFLAAETRQPAKAALRAGQAWGRYLAERPLPFDRVDSAGATRQVIKVLDDIGFVPEATTSGRKRQILLHHCPFRETAEAHSEIVCSIHLGLMQGMFAELDAPLTAESLDPFVEPSLCITRLASTQSRAGNGHKRG